MQEVRQALQTLHKGPLFPYRLRADAGLSFWACVGQCWSHTCRGDFLCLYLNA